MFLIRYCLTVTIFAVILEYPRVYALLTLIPSLDVFYLFQIKDSGLGEDEQKADVETQAEDNIIGKRLIVLGIFCVNNHNTSCISLL